MGFTSFASVALSTMALLLVLSVFNGLESLMKSLFRSFDPDIKIELVKGKSFPLESTLIQQIESVEGVSKVVEVIEDNVLLRYRDQQMVVKLKGVSENFLQESRLEEFIEEGVLRLKEGPRNWAAIGRGIKYALSVNLSNVPHALHAFYPKHIQGSVLTPHQLYQQKDIMPGAVFAIEKQFDENYVIVPLDFATDLMNMGNKRTALEIQVAAGFANKEVQNKLKAIVPLAFQVLNSDEQHANLTKAIKIERFFVFVTFAFILVVASLNIFFTLSMLVLTKRKDIALLYVLGATPQQVKSIFLIEGMLIALLGTVIGVVAALVISWLQQNFGLIALGIQTSVVDAYPIKKEVHDFVYTVISVIIITLLTTYRPAQLAAQTSIDFFQN